MKPGLPKKYAKLGFKKGWVAFKKALRARKKPKTTTARAKPKAKAKSAKAAPKKKSTGGTTVAKRKGGLPSKYAKLGFKRGWAEWRKVHGKTKSHNPGNPKRGGKAVAKTVVRYAQNPMVRAFLKEFGDLGLMTAGGLTSAFAIRKGLQAWTPMAKALLQGGIGAAAIITPQREIRKMGKGVLFASLLGLIYDWSDGNLSVIAGKTRKFSQDEINQLRNYQANMQGNYRPYNKMQKPLPTNQMGPQGNNMNGNNGSYTPYNKMQKPLATSRMGPRRGQY